MGMRSFEMNRIPASAEPGLAIEAMSSTLKGKKGSLLYRALEFDMLMMR